LLGIGHHDVPDLLSALTDRSLGPKRQIQIAAAFHSSRIDDGLSLLNYRENNSHNFLPNSNLTDTESHNKANARREFSRLVVCDNGEVHLRPLHKFFCLGQIPEVSLQQLQGKQISLVTKKLDGQMVSGVMIQGGFQLWTRAGPTGVGMQAHRVATDHSGDYSGLIQLAMMNRHTAVFEFTGKQSHLKANEGNVPVVTLLAIRHHETGDYLSYEVMSKLARFFRVPLVQRFAKLETLSLEAIRDEVETWQNCEGVVIRLTEGTWLKIKSKWWINTGYSKAFTEKIANRIQDEKVKLRDKKIRLQHHSLRLAVTNIHRNTTAFDIKAWFPESRKVELVYTHGGFLTRAIASFTNKAQRDQALLDPANGDLMLQQAYSVRTRTNARVRVRTFYF
jgi:hypothetical protein